jgi:CBS domain-containing protein
MERDERMPQELPVSHVYTVGSAGAVARGTVSCPHRQCTVSEEDCQSCPRIARVERDASGELRKVWCHVNTHAAEEGAESLVKLRRASVRELMSRNVICVRPELSVDAVVALFVETALKAVPVVDEHGQVLGMLEERDVQQAIHAERSAGAEAPSRCAGDLMMPVPFTIREQLSAFQAAGLLVYEAVGRVPVVSGEGQVVGILSASDLLYWLARADGYVLPTPSRD